MSQIFGGGGGSPGDIHLGILSLWIVFKAVRLDKILEGTNLQIKKRRHKEAIQMVDI